ncbi:MAG: DUF3450 family protein [Verrucomicrobiales bacterium]|nr:DUF3450 family protein [Verrucomicrobiales bacterium]
MPQIQNFCIFAAILALTGPVSTGFAQDPAAKPESTDPKLVQEKLRQWVDVKKTISAEKADWEAKKTTLADLNELRKQEIGNIDELIEAAGSRLADAEKRRVELLTEEEELRAWRADFQKTVDALETRIVQLARRFPPPLTEKLDDALARLHTTEEETPLQNRFRDLVAILAEAGNFQNTITVDTDLREIDGKQIEVDVLYLGLTQAFFVDRAGKNAGIGHPGDDGWTWQPVNRLAGEIRQAIAVQRKESPPAFVELPIGKEAG